MLTYKNIVNDFEQLVKEHMQLKSFGSGDVNQLIYWTQQIDGKDNDEDNAPVYPILYLIPNTVTRGEQEISYSFNVIIADIMDTKTSYNIQTQLWSDLLQIAEDVLAQFKYSVSTYQGDYEAKYDIEFPATLTPFNEQYDDNLVGWNMDINIVLDNPLNRCIAPFTDFTD